MTNTESTSRVEMRWIPVTTADGRTCMEMRWVEINQAAHAHQHAAA